MSLSPFNTLNNFVDEDIAVVRHSFSLKHHLED